MFVSDKKYSDIRVCLDCNQYVIRTVCYKKIYELIVYKHINVA